MANDLEKFLQQAAERLKDKIQQQQAAQRPQHTPPPRQRPPVVPSHDEVIQATVVNPRELGDNPLSSIDTRPPVGSERRPQLAPKIANRDELMTGHLHQVFDHPVSRLQNASTALAPTGGATADQTDRAIEVNRRDRMSSPLLRMLRKPDTLRAAFIASEIFRRKF